MELCILLHLIINCFQKILLFQCEKNGLNMGTRIVKHEIIFHPCKMHLKHELLPPLPREKDNTKRQNSFHDPTCSK